MIAVKEHNRIACEPRRSRDLRLHLHRRRSLPGVTSAYRAIGTRNFILIDRTPIHCFYALVTNVDLTTCCNQRPIVKNTSPVARCETLRDSLRLVCFDGYATD